MKNIFSKSGGFFIPAILFIALISTTFVATRSISRLKKSARVINYIGIVQGTTQKIIKEEMNYGQDDSLIEQIDMILEALVNGSDESVLTRLDSDDFQSLLLQMQQDWNEIKKCIISCRTGASNEKLYDLSEAYFDLTDEAALAAKTHTEQITRNAETMLIMMNVSFFFIAAGYMIFALHKEKCSSQSISTDDENDNKIKQLSMASHDMLSSLNDIPELIYVADTKTYDLLFINEAGKNTFNIPESLDGLKCHKALLIKRPLDGMGRSSCQNRNRF